MKRPTIRRAATACALIASASVCSISQAALNIDLRATGINGSALSGPNTSKSIINVQVGDVISFDIFAVITGTNATLTDDRFVSVSGNVVSGPVGTKGTLLADIVRSVTDPDTGDIITAGFDAPGASVGLQQDLDGDGDIDVGSNIDSQAANHWAVRYLLAPAGAVAGSINPTTGGRRIGFGTFTVTAPFGTPAELNFDGRNAGTAANYFQDGVSLQQPSVDGLLPILVQGVPEPTSFSLTVGGALTLLRRRRSRPGTRAR